MRHSLSAGSSRYFFWHLQQLGGGAEKEATHQSPLLEAVFFAFIEEICLRAPQIDNLWAAISLENRREDVKSLSLNLKEFKIKNFWINSLAIDLTSSVILFDQVFTKHLEC